MSTDSTPPASEVPQPLPPLNSRERRLLGVLVEKAKTTPDTYPLSLNSLVTGSNQKSNRDPVLSLAEVEVEDSLNDLQKKGLVTRIMSGRVDRWRHNLYEVWQVNKVELAILAELLLRGPQTEGELRGRASRMEPITDLDHLREVLQPLKARGLIVYLGPEGRRGTTLTHGFYTPTDLERLRATSRIEESAEEPTSSPRASSGPSVAADKIQALEAELATVRTDLAALKEQLGELTATVQALKTALGA